MVDIMREQKETTYNVRISSNGKYNPVTKYNETLTENGFSYNKRQTEYSSFYEKNNVSALDANIWDDWAARRRLNCHIVDMKYTRSDSYRQEYFKNNKPEQPAKYRCVYCGRKLLYKDVTVDHLYPINKLMYEPRIQKRAKRHGIDGANDVKNLVCACRRCNSKKGTKMGFWLIRGWVGRHAMVWKLRNLTFWCLFIFCAYVLYVKTAVIGVQPHLYWTHI